MRTIQETGAWHGQNQYGRPFRYLKPTQQLQVLVTELGKSHLHAKRALGIGSLKARAYVAHQFLADVRRSGFDLQNLLNLGQKHVNAGISTWKEKELSPSTIQTRMSILRWLAVALGKRGLIMDPSYYGLEPAQTDRTYVATVDRSWSAKDVIAAEKVSAAKAIDKWVGHQLDLIRVFGLRVREAIMIRPAAADHQSVLRVEEGTKGGRMRVVQIRTEEQRQVLDAAKALALNSARGSMCPNSRTFAAAKRRLYYVLCERLKLTKKDLGCTAHGLRHEYANDLYEEISGVASPVRGGSANFDRDRDIEARTHVTADLGHARLSIVSAYVGARPTGRPPSSRRTAAVDAVNGGGP